MSTQSEGATPETSVNEEGGGLEQWKLTLIALGAVAAFVGSILSGVAYALGSVTGAIIGYYAAIRIATGAYRQYEQIQLGIIPHRVYRGICVFSALLSILGAFLLQSPGNGTFLLSYFFLGGLALPVFAIRKFFL
jgi:hypothetical protein